MKSQPTTTSLLSPTWGKRRRRALRSWFKRKSRTFAWRSFDSPWHVLLAEMLLLRTRADVVENHISRVVARFPTAEAMAREEVPVIEEVLRPFGLRWRARRLHELARIIATRFDGNVPIDLDQLLSLPGVGPYVASATLSLLTDRSVVLVDANTVRVGMRVASLTLPGDVRRHKNVVAAVTALMAGPTKAGDWLAVIDLAASVCVARVPKCPACPIHNLCGYGLAIESA